MQKQIKTVYCDSCNNDINIEEYEMHKLICEEKQYLNGLKTGKVI